jgi:hypothetical protein
MSTSTIIGLIVVVVCAIAISVWLRQRGENEAPRQRAGRMQREAQRFARRLVSDIKLYNEARVAEARRNHDLYDQLREDIDRSRAMYDRAGDSMADRDYFHEAVVEILCNGDATMLGPDYPGPRAHTIQ